MQGRTALITGGAGHIGFAIAEGLAEAGANIAILDIDQSKADEACQKLADTYGVKTLAIAIDLASDQEVRDAAQKVAKELGGISSVINCAAFVGTSDLEGWACKFDDQNFDTWRKALEVNLTAPTLLIQQCAPFLRESGHGSVINIGSTYGVGGADWSLYEGTEMGQPGAYAASKGGLMQMTRWLSTYYAPDIRINAISPGGVYRGQPDSFHEKYVARTPMGRMASEEDFKGAALFLASDLSNYVTGQNIMVDGGWTAW